jgi:hypothetical protein
MIAELPAGTVRPVVFYEGEFAAGVVRFWTGVGDLSWNGQTWRGVGTLLSVSTISETADIRAEGMTLSLSGISSDIISLVLTQCRLGLPGRVWFGFTLADGQVIADPYLAFSGKLDVPVIDDEGTQCTVSLSYESQLIDLERPREFRWTHQTQLSLHPGSLGFAFVSEQSDIKLVF